MIKIRWCFINIPNIYIYKIGFIKLIIYELGLDVWKLEAGVWGGGSPFFKEARG
jgi:hypothetical protein